MRAVKERWGLEVIGVVPYGELMDAPAWMDFENIFNTKLMSGSERRLEHFEKFELAVTDLNLFLAKLDSGEHNHTLFFTHFSRSDIVAGYLTYAEMYERKHNKQFGGGTWHAYYFPWV